MYICLYIYTFLSLNRIRDKCPGLVSTYALQHAATHCNTTATQLQHTATHCNGALRFSATYSYPINRTKFTLSQTHTHNKHTHTGPGQTHNMAAFLTFVPAHYAIHDLALRIPPWSQGGCF